MLASRAIRHVENKIEISVEGDRDLHSRYREILARATSNLWRTPCVLADRSLDTF